MIFEGTWDESNKVCSFATDPSEIYAAVKSGKIAVLHVPEVTVTGLGTAELYGVIETLTQSTEEVDGETEYGYLYSVTVADGYFGYFDYTDDGLHFAFRMNDVNN